MSTRNKFEFSIKWFVPAPLPRTAYNPPLRRGYCIASTVVRVKPDVLQDTALSTELRALYSVAKSRLQAFSEMHPLNSEPFKDFVKRRIAPEFSSLPNIERIRLCSDYTEKFSAVEETYLPVPMYVGLLDSVLPFIIGSLMRDAIPEGVLGVSMSSQSGSGACNIYTNYYVDEPPANRRYDKVPFWEDGDNKPKKRAREE